jgi:hypothetical protein
MKYALSVSKEEENNIIPMDEVEVIILFKLTFYLIGRE